MKRILFVDHVSRILGGGEINLVELLSAAGQTGRWTVACACPQESRLSQALKEIRVQQWDYGFAESLNTLRVVGRRFSLLRSLRGLAALCAARRRLEKVIADFRPEAVVSCTNKDHFCAVSACATASVRSVWWVNDIISADFFPRSVRLMFCWRARRASHLITVSNFARQALVSQGLRGELVTTIHNGIPLDRYQRGQRGFLRRQFGLPNDEPLIGILGRYTPWKGQELFLRVAHAWTRENSSGHFVLIGNAFNEEEKYESSLRQFVTEHRLGKRVHFVPFQSNVAAALSDLEVLIHASLRPEPFGRVIIEAMALGVPVIAARAGGVPEIIADGVDGLLANPGDTSDYVIKLRELFASKDLAGKLSRAARETVQKRFTLEVVEDAFERVLSDSH